MKGMGVGRGDPANLEIYIQKSFKKDGIYNDIFRKTEAKRIHCQQTHTSRNSKRSSSDGRKTVPAGSWNSKRARDRTNIVCKHQRLLIV